MSVIASLNNLLYNSRDRVLAVGKWITFSVALFAFAIIIYENGFIVPHEHLKLIRKAFDIVLVIFVLHYFVRLIYSFNRIKFLKNNWFEGVLMLLVCIVSVSKLFFGFSITQNIILESGTNYAKDIYRYAITVSILYLVGFELIKISSYLNYLSIKPAATFILSFILLIVIGTGLLMLPRMTVMDGSASFMQAFFTSVSASCVTGLAVVDTGSFFTLKGQLVILILFQLGGIGIVSFATFFATFLKKGVGIKHQLIIQDVLNSESLSSSRTLLRQVIGITLSIELIATVCIFFTWGNNVPFDNLATKLFYSIFHAVSAFCNAGFSLFSNSLYEPVLQNAYLLHVIVAITIIVGGLGFSTIQDLMSPTKLRERLEKPWKDWLLSSKIALYTSVVLIISGTIIFFLLENNNEHTMADKTVFEKLILSFFQSVTARTAGFNTIDIGSMTVPSIILMIFLMFIGSSSGSTGGGIKTSTFLLITKSAFATIRGRKYVELGKRTISPDLLNKAFSIFIFAATYNFFMVFILTITDGEHHIVKLLFEQISAFATVGLSTGITTDLSVYGKLILILSMFVGRVGTLTLALALSSRVKCNTYQYPQAHLMVG